MEATCQRCAHTHTHAGDCGHTHDQQGTGFLILSFLLLVGGVILRYLQLPFWMIPGVEVLWFLLAFLPVGFPVMVEVWKSIRQKDIFNEFSLMLFFIRWEREYNIVQSTGPEGISGVYWMSVLKKLWFYGKGKNSRFSPVRLRLER